MTITGVCSPVVSSTVRGTAGGVGGGLVSTYDMLIGTRGTLGGYVESTLGKQHQSRITITVCHDATDIRLVFAGTRGSTALPSGITVKAALWKNGVAYQCLFGGNTSVTLGADELATSDVLTGLTLSRGDSVSIITYAAVTTGTSLYAMQYMHGRFGDGAEWGSSLTDKTMTDGVTAAVTNNAVKSLYTCSGIIGAVTGTKYSSFIFGDSLSIGTGDDLQIGYPGIGLGRNLVPFLRCGSGGTTAAAGILLTETDPQIRALIPYTNAAVWEYGINSISSGVSAASLRSQAEDFAAEFLSLVPDAKLCITTVHAYPNAANDGPQNDGYWSPAKDLVRVAYNDALRAGLPTGFNSLWDVCGDASGASGLWQGGMESSENSGIYRADYATQQASNLHPNRPMLMCMASGLNVTEWLGIPQVWGPEIAYVTIPSSGEYAEAKMVRSRVWQDNFQSLTGLTTTDGAFVAADYVDAENARFYMASRFTSGTKTITIGTNNFVDSLGNTMRDPVRPLNVTNSSAWVRSPELGSTLASDDFNRADTAYDATANNNTIGASWTDHVGSAAKITGNNLYIQGSASQRVIYNAATYADCYAEFTFDPADFTASDSINFCVRLGCRLSLANNNGIVVLIDRGAASSGSSAIRLLFARNGTPTQQLGSANFTWSNGTRYKIGLKVAGSGSAKTIVAYIYNATTGVLLSSLTGTTSLATFTDQTGYVGFIASHSATNSSAQAIVTEYIVDDFVIKTGVDATVPVISAATLLSSRLVNLDITETTAPLTPTSSLTGFTVKVDGSPVTISEAFLYGADNIRLVLAASASGTVTVSYDQALGNVLDSSGNELEAFTDYAVV